MSGKTLRIVFQGVIAFVPDRRFDQKPTQVDVIIPNLEEGKKISGEAGESVKLCPHHAWLEMPWSDEVHSRGDLPSIWHLGREGTKSVRTFMRMPGGKVKIFLDEAAPSGTQVEIDDSVLQQLAVYQGPVKSQYDYDSSLDPLQVAAGFRLRGGKLSVLKSAQNPYKVPLYNGETDLRLVATALEWATGFQSQVAFQFRGVPQRPLLRFSPLGDTLTITIRSREAIQMLSPVRGAVGGVDDEEFLVYGNMTVGGVGSVLRASKVGIPGGKKACGTGGIQP